MSAASPLAITLEGIASRFEGIIPSSICTCSADGTPNMTYLSVVHRIDSHHVGLSYQFFNKTHENMVHNPFVQVVVVSSSNLRQYRLDLRYERTETEGAVFSRMKTRLDAVASQTGMSQVFRLHGVDVFQVLDCRPMNAETGWGESSQDGLSSADRRIHGAAGSVQRAGSSNQHVARCVIDAVRLRPLVPYGAG